MSRSFKDFQDAKTDRGERTRKNLRNNGREAYNFFSDIEDSKNDSPKSDEKSSIWTYSNPGRGVGGESSN